MKTNVKTKLEAGTLGGDEIRMGIHQDAVGHITGVLTKMYANPPKACVREYSTNAWDSHIEAGNGDPIEVELPTVSQPRLRIRDWGVGLDEQGIREIYSQYGASTKRNTNAQNGMLGIGCKSALAYTDQFTVTAVKSGIMTQALVSYDEDGAGKFTLLEAKPVGVPDGVEVSIPVKHGDIHNVADLARDFFRFWQPNQVLLDGHQPERIDGLWLDEHTLLTDQVDEDLVVMGGVAYPLVDGEQPLFTIPGRSYGSPKYHAVCFVPIGSVSFAPSRESLMTTKRTTETLAKLRDHVAAVRDKSVREQIANATSAAEAQQLLVKGQAVGFSGEAKWQGQLVVLSLKRERPTDPNRSPNTSAPDEWPVEVALKHSYLHLSHNRYSRKNGERVVQVDLQRSDTIFFVGFDGKNMTNVKRAKLELWWNQQPVATDPLTGITKPVPHTVFIDKLSDHEKFWLSGRSIYNWADVDALQLPKSTSADGSTVRIKGSYDALVKGDKRYDMAAAELAKRTEPIYWFHGNPDTASYATEVRSGAIALSDCIIVCLGANRIDKFTRDFPQAKRLSEAAKELAMKWEKAQDKEVEKAYWIQQECSIQGLKKLDPSSLDDPDLKKLSKIASTATDAFSRGRSTWAKWLTQTAARNRDDVKWADAVLTKYPLYLETCGRYGTSTSKSNDHMTLYLNAAYAAGRS